MSNRVRIWWLAGLLSGCGAAPENHYYVLSAATTSEGPTISPDRSTSTVTVHLPALLDREEIVIGTGPHSVQICQFDRWAAPLDEMVPRVLAADLRADEVGDHFTRERRIAVHVDEFMADADGVVRLTGTWSELPEQTRFTTQTWRFSLQIPTDAQRTPDVAASMSRLLAQLAEAIARTS